MRNLIFKMENLDLKKALTTASQILSKRSYSLKEIREKLLKKYPLDIVEETLEALQKNNWLESEQDLSQKLAEELHQKKKSWAYIKNYFVKKGLPLPAYDECKEKDKISMLVLKRFQTQSHFTKEQKEQIKKFLAYRGFSLELTLDLFSEK